MNPIAFFLSPVGKAAAIAFAIAGILWAADHRGYQRAERACQTAGLKAKIAILQADKAAADAAALQAEANATRNASAAAANAKIIEEFRNAPKPSACRLSDSDVRRLRKIN